MKSNFAIMFLCAAICSCSSPKLSSKSVAREDFLFYSSLAYLSRIITLSENGSTPKETAAAARKDASSILFIYWVTRHSIFSEVAPDDRVEKMAQHMIVRYNIELDDPLLKKEGLDTESYISRIGSLPFEANALKDGEAIEQVKEFRKWGEQLKNVPPRVQ